MRGGYSSGGGGAGGDIGKGSRGVGCGSSERLRGELLFQNVLTVGENDTNAKIQVEFVCTQLLNLKLINVIFFPDR